MTDSTAPATQTRDGDQTCVRCGAVVAADGRTRHDAWHEFVESTLTGLTADLAALAPPVPPAAAR